jgi:hypothetical protein
MRKMRLNLVAFIAIVLCMILATNELMASTYYVATNGNDNNPGTITQPFATWQKGFDVAVAGDAVYIRGGVYAPARSWYAVRVLTKSGTASNPITVMAYPGEVPILDARNLTNATTNNYCLYMTGSNYWHLKGLYITGASQHSGNRWTAGFYADNCNGLKVENCKSFHNEGSGFAVKHASTNNLFLNCDSWNNYDPYTTSQGGDADGFEFSFITASSPLRTNRIEGCRMWYNSDDGLDMWRNNGIMEVVNCWSYRNGRYSGNGNGFKMGQADYTGSVQRYFYNCMAFDNKQNGMDQSSGNVLMVFYNNTVFRNASHGYYLSEYNLPQVLRNNIDFSNSQTSRFPALTVHDHNSWDGGVTLSNADFVSTDTTGISRARGSDGSLPTVNFLRLASGSDLIDAGVNVGLSYLGKAPDLGLYEFTSTASSIPVSGITVTGTSGATAISTNQGTLQLSASISPTNATNKSVTWSIQNGTGQGSISTSGLVTAISNGTVSARATAIDGSGVSGTLAITISNQTTTVTNPIIRSDGCSIITARSGNLDRETPAMAFDNLSSTKWYNYNASGNIWMQYQFCSGSSYVINSYSLTSANDMPLRDPRTVSISGSNDGVNFTLLDTKTNIAFSSRYQKLTFTFTNTKAYQYYKFDMAANPGNDGLQVSEIELIETGSALKSTQMVEFSKGMVTVSPNPFREALTIDYNLPEDTHVNLVVYDLNGMVVRQLVNENQTEGSHRIVWDALNSKGSNLHNGIYILKMETAFGSEISKIIYTE